MNAKDITEMLHGWIEDLESQPESESDRAKDKGIMTDREYHSYLVGIKTALSDVIGAIG